MAVLCIDEAVQEARVHDPCCGSGRMLLAYADHHGSAELIGQDIDLRCVKMTAINLALRNRYGYVLWGNSLARECKLGYRTGMNMAGGFIRYMRPGELTERLGAPNDGESLPQETIVVPAPRHDGPAKQLQLF